MTADPTDMLDRVARAIAPEWFGGGQLLEHFPGEALRHQRDARVKARAAIEALREPTGAMLGAACDVSIAPDPMNLAVTYANAREAKEIWEIMIDAALEEPGA